MENINSTTHEFADMPISELMHAAVEDVDEIENSEFADMPISELMHAIDVEDDELQHWGIKGMKWGVRRYQNPDGSLTEAGQKRRRKLQGKLDKLDGKKSNSDSATPRKKKISEMDDEELKNYVNRKAAEQRAYQLDTDIAKYTAEPPTEKSFGKQLAENIKKNALGPALTDAVKKLATGSADKLIRKMLSDNDPLAAKKKQAEEAELDTKIANAERAKNVAAKAKLEYENKKNEASSVEELVQKAVQEAVKSTVNSDLGDTPLPKVIPDRRYVNAVSEIVNRAEPLDPNWRDKDFGDD